MAFIASMVRETLDERIGQFRDDEERIRRTFGTLAPVMDERQRRLWAGAEAKTSASVGSRLSCAPLA